MAFKFRLQSVLNHRLYLEDMARSEMVLCIQAKRDCEDRILWLREEMLRIRRDMTEKEKNGINASSFILTNDYVTVLRLQALREEAKLPMINARVEEARLKLVKAVQNRKVLETLCDRDRGEYNRAQLAAEQNLLDEVAVGAYVRGQSL